MQGHPQEPRPPERSAEPPRREPGKTPGSAEGEDPPRSPRVPDVGRTPGSAEGELDQETERWRR